MEKSRKPKIRFKGYNDDWEQRKLEDIVGIYDGVHQTPNYQNSGVMFLSVENIATLKSSKFLDSYKKLGYISKMVNIFLYCTNIRTVTTIKQHYNVSTFKEMTL